MFTKDSGFLHGLKSFFTIRFIISSLVSLSLASIILWCLLSIYPPSATLTAFNIEEKTDKSSVSLYIELEIHNRNLFRGFNYTNGWIDVFDMPRGSELNYKFISDHKYQDFGENWYWNFTLNSNIPDWDTARVKLQKNETYFYLSLYLSYWNKILSWKTRTIYYCWLEANVYLNDKFALTNVTPFHTMKNFTLATST